MNIEYELTGWNHLVYTIIHTKFNNKVFSLKEIYNFFDNFKTIYPQNHHIEEKIRQTLQNLKRLKFVTRIKPGIYQMIRVEEIEQTEEKTHKDYVYLVSNESIPGWVKIGRTNSIKKRLRTLYNSSVPFPFKIEKVIETQSIRHSLALEKGIHSFIDTINPSLRKETLASKREFFKLSVDKGVEIFVIVEEMLSAQLT